MPIIFDDKTLTLTMNNAMNMGYWQLDEDLEDGEDTVTIVSDIMLDYDSGYLTYSKAVSMSGIFEADPDYGNICEIGDNGSWANHSVTGFLLQQFSAMPPSSSTAYKNSTLISLLYPTLVEYQLTGAKANAAEAKSMAAKQQSFLPQAVAEKLMNSRKR